MELHVSGGAVVRGSFRPPGDKSISHRAAMLAAICEGQSFISGYPDSEDCASTARCLRALGVGLHKDGDTLVVSGRGLRGLREPEDVLDAGNSGTSIRLLSGLLAGQSGLFILTGDQSLRRRPMGRITQPLRAMGAKVDGRADGTLAPLVIRGAGREPLRACRHVLPVASAQVKSCILLAGLYAEGATVVVEPAPSRDHTERMLRFMGVDIQGGAPCGKQVGGAWLVEGEATGCICGSGRSDPAAEPLRAGIEPLHMDGPSGISPVEISIESGQVPRPFKLQIPGDPSSAAFFLAAAAVLPGSSVTAMRVCANPTRLGFIRAIARMGAAVT
ncbi:MAG: 3-phosphoshikimate 1-carboxyvinyltransferase, partial [Bacillota bacterium]